MLGIKIFLYAKYNNKIEKVKYFFNLFFLCTSGVALVESRLGT